MAIARGAGTEIIRTISFEDIDSTIQTAIIGVQHHIYTVLSVIAYCDGLQAAGNLFYLYLLGWDAKAGASQQRHTMWAQSFSAIGETAVWNDKFSFTGVEATGVSGAMSSVAEQDALADQGGSATQNLEFGSTHASDAFEVVLTYIDQNNS